MGARSTYVKECGNLETSVVSLPNDMVMLLKQQLR